MNAFTDQKNGLAGEVRADFVPTEHYISPDFLRLEGERLWPKVWQVACREEELDKVGAYVTYEIMGDSIIVVRSAEDRIKAFHNVCPHRGRRLTEGCGRTGRFHCKFHAWQFDLDGAVTQVLDRDDWAGCADFTDRDLSLREVRVATWAGWVFINMDPDAKPLTEFLDPVPHYLDPYELQKMRYRWYISVRTPCNWKVALEAFNEGYHVAGTHPQLLATFGDDTSRSRTFGPHGNFLYPKMADCPMGAPSPRLGLPIPDDLRPCLMEYYDVYNRTLHAIYSERDVEATRRLMTEAPAGAPFGELMAKLLQFQREASVASGAGWPEITPQQMGEAGVDWHIFPNLIILPAPGGALAYRALPDARDPDVSIFEVYSLQRYAPGAEPPLERKYLHGPEDWKKFQDISLILQQDFDNMGEVQKGMKSRGFRGARTNPLQESVVSNFHRVLEAYVRETASR